MIAVPKIIPISTLRDQPTKVLSLLSDRPLVITQRSRAAAVLVHPEQWNRLVEDLEDAFDTIEALKAKLKLATGEDELVDWAEAVEANPAAIQT